MAKKIDKDLKDALLLNPYKIWVGDDYYLSRRVQLALFNNGVEWKGSSKIDIHPETESGDIKAILIDDGRMSYDSRIINEVDFNGNQGIGYLELEANSIVEEPQFKNGDFVEIVDYGRAYPNTPITSNLNALITVDPYRNSEKLQERGRIVLKNDGYFKNGELYEIVAKESGDIRADDGGATYLLTDGKGNAIIIGKRGLKLSEKPTQQLEDDIEIKKDGLVNAFFEKNKDKLKRIFEKNPKTHKKLIESLDKLAEYEECAIKKPSNEESIQEAKSRLMESILNLK